MNNNIIPFKKNILFKTKIADVTDITLTHDFKILDELVEGKFYLSGAYKITEASVIEEDFYYEIPFSIALSDRIKKESINLTISDFKYSFKDDTMMINMDLSMDFEEEVQEERNVEDVIENINEEEVKKEEETEIEDQSTIINPVETEISNSTISNLLSELNDSIDFTTYKVHIVRNDDTFESIASKYNVSLDNIKEYNKTENINIGDKILVPFINE